MTDTPTERSTVALDAFGLGWDIAAAREAEGDQYRAQLERVRQILTDLDSDIDEAGLVRALERIADVVGLGAENVLARGS